MGMASLSSPPIPDLSVVTEVIRLADAAAAERHERPVAAPIDTGDEFDPQFRPSPARQELVAHLHRLQERDDGRTVAQLYGLYKAGDLACTTREEATERDRDSTELALQPIHRPYGAGDLASQAPLADGLRRGLAHLGAATDRVRSSLPATHNPPNTQEDDAMKKIVGYPEIEAAADAARDIVARLMELVLDPDTDRARAAADVLATLGTRAVEATMAAFPRAATTEKRAEFLHILGYATPGGTSGSTDSSDASPAMTPTGTSGSRRTTSDGT